MNSLAVQQAEKLAAKLSVAGSGEELISTLKATAFKGQVSDAQMAALLIVAQQYGLSPWTREIYAYPDKNNGIVPVVGVDGWARIINTHPQFDGMDFDQDADSCTCVIYRKDRNHPIRVTEYMDECHRPSFKTKDGYEIKGPWQSHPKRMLRHKAMIQCARLAFGYGGIYDQDEAERMVSERDMGPAQVVEPAQPEYPDAELKRLLPQWQAWIDSGAGSAARVIDKIASKYALRQDQIKAIQDLEITENEMEVIDGNA